MIHTYTRCHWLVGIQKKIETLFAFFGTPCMFTRAQSNPHRTHLDSSRRTLMASRTGQTLWFPKTERRAKTCKNGCCEGDIFYQRPAHFDGSQVVSMSLMLRYALMFLIPWNCTYPYSFTSVLRARSTVPASEQRLLRSYGPSRGITGDRIHMYGQSTSSNVTN